MNEQEIEGYCPTCAIDKWSWIRAQHKQRQDSEEHGIWWVFHHRILECKSCSTNFYQREETNSEDLDLWYDNEGQTRGRYIKRFEYFPPKLLWPRPAWSSQVAERDPSLEKILAETYTAFENDLHILAAIGVRTAFDRMSGPLGVDTALSFEEKLAELVELGRITGDEKAELNILIEAGNAAAHRGWDPNENELRGLLQYLELFIFRTLLPAPTLSSLQGAIPPKQKRAKRIAKE